MIKLEQEREVTLVMERAFDMACGLLSTMSRDELWRLQERIVALLRGQEGPGLDDRLTEEQLGAELDAAVAEFDRGEGYSADEMLVRVRSEFGW